MIEKIHSTDVIEIVNKLNEIIDFLNDTYLMKVNDGQYVMADSCELATDFMSKLSDSSFSILDNSIESGISLKDAKCPHCGESYYMEMESMSTCVYYPHIWKDGVNINPDRNKSTTHCKCLNCGEEFDI